MSCWVTDYRKILSNHSVIRYFSKVQEPEECICLELKEDILTGEAFPLCSRAGSESLKTLPVWCPTLIVMACWLCEAKRGTRNQFNLFGVGSLCAKSMRQKDIDIETAFIYRPGTKIRKIYKYIFSFIACPFSLLSIDIGKVIYHCPISL